MTYSNPWHKRYKEEYGPEYYETKVNPIEYKGHLIFQRIEGRVWDVVKNGKCVTQRAGLNGAKRAIDLLTSEKEYV
jgi:hypothetical protein